MIQLLLYKRIDVNAKGGIYDNALQAASKDEYQTMIQLLLNNKTHFNAQRENGNFEKEIHNITLVELYSLASHYDYQFQV